MYAYLGIERPSFAPEPYKKAEVTDIPYRNQPDREGERSPSTSLTHELMAARFKAGLGSPQIEGLMPLAAEVRAETSSA
jgi:hypothetical protein